MLIAAFCIVWLLGLAAGWRYSPLYSRLIVLGPSFLIISVALLVACIALNINERIVLSVSVLLMLALNITAATVIACFKKRFRC